MRNKAVDAVHPTELLAKARGVKPTLGTDDVRFILFPSGCRPALRVPQLHADPIDRSPNHHPPPPRPACPFPLLTRCRIPYPRRAVSRPTRSWPVQSARAVW